MLRNNFVDSIQSIIIKHKSDELGLRHKPEWINFLLKKEIECNKKLEDIREKKYIIVREQRYEDAAILVKDERNVLQELEVINQEKTRYNVYIQHSGSTTSNGSSIIDGNKLGTAK